MTVNANDKELYTLLERIFKEKKEQFIPGKTTVQYALAVYDHNEIFEAVKSLLSGWFGIGKYASEFEKEFSKFLGIKQCILANSGSSANLLAVEALQLPKGAEAITPATTFPTTINPLIQKGIKPVLMDINPTTYNINASELKKAFSKKVKLLMLPHTLGNPNEIDQIMEFAEERDLHVIEDACDALGSRYDGRYVSTFGDMGTFSFYPAHHITMGEGGAVVTNNEELSLNVRSFRDWGRACVCPVCTIALDPNAYCPLRFMKTPLPDYDKRFTYITVGYNLKPLDLQAAMGLQQLRRFPQFMQKRKENFKKLYSELLRFEDYFVLPESLPKADPCWFAFPITVKEKVPFKRKDIVNFLEEHRIATRPLFAGNILRQPAYKDMDCRVVGKLENSDRVMKSSFFIGVHPGLTEEMLNYMIETFEEFIRKVK
ncbi:lipopolysaccharide biosynthesis protein RfbH [Candidatus Bathyarchaeota archaeon]|nr:lipopolysaccharide biosynthesis protein RfbH [Candidatus Bathyarchaeota archaeon]